VGWGEAGCSAAGCGKTVVSGGDAPEALQPAEQPLDGIGLGRGVGPKQLFWRRLALDRTFASAPAGSIASRAAIRIEGAVGDPQGALGNRLDQRLATAEVGCLGAQGDKRDRLAGLVQRSVDLGPPPITPSRLAAMGCPSARWLARAPPPFAPEALWDAFASVAASVTSAEGPPGRPGAPQSVRANGSRANGFGRAFS